MTGHGGIRIAERSGGPPTGRAPGHGGQAVFEPPLTSPAMAFALSPARLAQRRPQAASIVRASWPVVAVVLLGSLWIGHYAAQSNQWAVMTDELQTERLALSVLRHHTPVPTIHGVHVAIYSQLYPLLIAPFYVLPTTTAFKVVHVFNAVLMASTAIPVYLTARLVGASRIASVVAATMTILVPWVALATTLLTEVAALPAFVWAVYLLVRAMAEPSYRNDGLALFGLALAVLARTQLAVLGVLAPLALVLHSALPRDAAIPGPTWRRVRDEILGHRVLIAGYAVIVLYVVARVVAGHRVSTLLGTYAGTASGDILPPGVLSSAISHLDVVAVGAGYVPFVLATSWVLSTFVRPQTKGAHAFAVVTVLVVPALAIEVASFDLRFTPGAFMQDRYLCYVAPLLFIGAVALFGDARQWRTPLRWGSLLAAGLICGWLVGRANYTPGTPIYWAAPAAAFHGVLKGRSEQIGSYLGISNLGIAELLRWGTLPLVLLFGALLQRQRATVALAILGVGICGFLFAETRYVLVRHGVPLVARQVDAPFSERDWIDRAAPSGARVALLPSAPMGDVTWWNAEFWNKRVDLVYTTPGANTFTPFPADVLETGRDGGIRATATTPWVVQEANESRFAFAGAKTVAKRGPLALVHVPTPFRAAWAVRSGLFNDSWSEGGTRVEIDVFAVEKTAQRRRFTLFLLNSPPEGIRQEQRYSVAVDGVTRARGRIAPTRSAIATVAVCVRPGASSRVTLRVGRELRIADGRQVGLYLARVQSTPAGRC
jgi:hypothetical protein